MTVSGMRCHGCRAAHSSLGNSDVAIKRFTPQMYSLLESSSGSEACQFHGGEREGREQAKGSRTSRSIFLEPSHFDYFSYIS